MGHLIEVLATMSEENFHPYIHLGFGGAFSLDSQNFLQIVSPRSHK